MLTAQDFVFNPDGGYFETPRTIIYECPAFTMSYHVADLGDGIQMTFFHLDWRQRTHNALREITRVFKLFRAHVNVPLFTMGDKDSAGLNRLRERHGFQHIGDIPCSDGNCRRLYFNAAT